MKFLTSLLMLSIAACASSLAAGPAPYDGAAQGKPTAAAAEAALTLAVQGGPETVLFASTADPAARRALDTWRGFLQDRKYGVKVVEPSEKPALPESGPVMAFETESACPIAGEIGLDLSGLKGARGESHLIVVRRWRDRPLALVVGKTPAGTDAGAARLLSLVRSSAGQVDCRPLEELRKPFFKGREMTLCCNDSAGRRFNYESWDRDRLARYPRFLQACGFNSVQLADSLTYWGHLGVTREQVAPVIRTIARSAHEQGMQVNNFIWGSELADAKDKRMTPAEFARTYADVADHVITHWGDPAPTGPASPAKLTAAVLSEYRKRNPKVSATISAWCYSGFWDSKHDATFAPVEIGIALQRWYDPAQADVVLKSGRRLGIWGWYLGDLECTIVGNWLRTRILDKYFSSLPDEAGARVDWISIEKCYHGGPSRINQFVAGQKMWSPKRPLRKIMLDYCGAMYGERFAPVICDAFECAEAAQEQITDGAFIPESDRFPEMWNDAEYAARLDRTLTAVRKVKLPQGWRPNLPDVGSAADDVQVLQEQLAEARAKIKSWAALLQVLKAGDARGVKSLCTAEGYASLFPKAGQAEKPAGETLKHLGRQWSKAKWSQAETLLGKGARNTRFRLYAAAVPGWGVAAEGHEPWLEFRRVGDKWLLAKRALAPDRR